MNNFLKLNNLSKKYEKNKSFKVLNNLNFEFKSGKIYSIVGPSGSGKSTLLNLMSLIDVPTSGSIEFNNKKIDNKSSIENDNIRSKNIGIIYQDNNLLTDFTAIENVMMPLIIKGVEKKKINVMANKILKELKILDRSNHFPNELSGGEQQRVAIARALISETNLILADEPTGNLDFKTSKEIFSLFLKLKKLKKTIIFATHNRELANKADYKLFISKGDIKRVNAR